MSTPPNARRHAAVNALGIALAIAAAIGFLSDQFLPYDFRLGRGGFIITLFFSSLLITVFPLISYLSPEQSGITSPNVVKYIGRGVMPEGGFISKPSPLLNQNLVYGVIHVEGDGMETIIGSVKYVMAQDNGLVQLMVIHRSVTAVEIWRQLDENDRPQLRDIRIKMGVPTDE